MILKLQHPFTPIVAGRSSCGKSSLVIRLLECREQICDVVFSNIEWRHRQNNVPHHLKKREIFKGLPDVENPENVPTLLVVIDLMDSAYSTNVIQLFTKFPGYRVHWTLTVENGILLHPSYNITV
jgi:hypothetical protein